MADKEAAPQTPSAVIICSRPDYCRSPKDVVPYQISVPQSELTNVSGDVNVTGYPAARSDSWAPLCYGDEGGTGGGVKSGTHLDECRVKADYSPTVLINGKGTVRHRTLFTMNKCNTDGKTCYPGGAPRAGIASGGVIQGDTMGEDAEQAAQRATQYGDGYSDPKGDYWGKGLVDNANQWLKEHPEAAVRIDAAANLPLHGMEMALGAAATDTGALAWLGLPAVLDGGMGVAQDAEAFWSGQRPLTAVEQIAKEAGADASTAALLSNVASMAANVAAMGPKAIELFKEGRAFAAMQANAAKGESTLGGKAAAGEAGSGEDGVTVTRKPKPPSKESIQNANRKALDWADEHWDETQELPPGNEKGIAYTSYKPAELDSYVDRGLLSGEALGQAPGPNASAIWMKAGDPFYLDSPALAIPTDEVYRLGGVPGVGLAGQVDVVTIAHGVLPNGIPFDSFALVVPAGNGYVIPVYIPPGWTGPAFPVPPGWHP
jgi:hypothetical protein